MRVTLNGEPCSLPDATTAADLVGRLRLEGRIALEVNRQVVPRSQWPQHALRDGDAVEIVRAIGGG